MEIKCGEDIVPYQWIDSSIVIQDYVCSETSSETSKVLSPGGHHLQFTFGGDVKFANNDATGAVEVAVSKSVNNPPH